MADRHCFAIMPFGEKETIEGEVVPFDDVYDHIIVPAIEKVEGLRGESISCTRSDRAGLAGWIHHNMITEIAESDVAVVDLTTLNPNVFYELGVRHSLRRHVTVLIRKKGTTIPFNIEGFNVIEYDLDIASANEAIGQITATIEKGLRSGDSDSLVHTVLPALRVTAGSGPQAIERKELIAYPLGDTGREAVIVTGDISRVREAAIWLSAENTNMQMARFYDRSLSAWIRYHGAERSAAGQVTPEGDHIATQLTAAMDGTFTVPPAHAIVTGPGRLEERGVKLLVHSAAVEGSVGGGYRPVADVGHCVRQALEAVDTHELGCTLDSVLIPMFGTGTGGGAVEETAASIVGAALGHFDDHGDCSLRRVLFLAHRDDQLRAFERALSAAGLAAESEPDGA